MFNFKEIRVIYDALQNSPSLERTDIMKKLWSMVSSSTFQGVAPCVRQKSEKITDDTEPAERMKVFETIRELFRDLEEIEFKQERSGRSQIVLISVPYENARIEIMEKLRKMVGPRVRVNIDQDCGGSVGTECGLRIEVIGTRHMTCGMTVEYVFFYNEVCGF